MTFDEGRVIVENRDCLDGLKEIESESIDCLVTDPPYRIISGGDTYNRFNMTGVISYSGDKLSRSGKLFEFNDIKFSEWLPDVYRVLKPNTHAYIMSNPRNLKELWIEAEKVGFKFQNLLVWDKGNAVPNKFYMNAYELVLMLKKGGQRWITDMGSTNILRIPNVRGKKHPTEKPVELMETLVLNSTYEGGFVLDPFVGVGATAIACLNNNRRFIGYEIDNEYYKTACSRLEEEGTQIKFQL